MESTNQRYATFLRQWKKRYNYSNFRNQYQKYERLPRSEGREKPQNLISTHHVQKESSGGTLHDSTKLKPAPQSFKAKQGRSSAAAVVSSKCADLRHGHEKLSDACKKYPSRLNRQRETKAQMITYHPPAEILQRTDHQRKIFTPTAEELPNVKKKSSAISHPVVSSAELADMEFWLLYGENAQSAASHFSYALLARIDQLLEGPAGNGRRSRTLKTTIQQKVIPTSQRETIQFKSPSKYSYRLPEMNEHSTRPGNSMKTKRKENCVYSNHSSDCADKYRLHILKFIKKTNKAYNLGMKYTTLDESSQTSGDKCFEKLLEKDTFVNLDDSGIGPIKERKRKDMNTLAVKKIQNENASILGDGRDCPSQKGVNVIAPKISDVSLAKKVRLNTSKNSTEMKLMKQMASASLIAMASSASSKPDHEQSDSHACAPSAGSSVTVYLPKCPLEADTTISSHSSTTEDARLQEDIHVQKRARLQKKPRQHGKADFKKGMEFVCDLNSNKDLDEEDGDEKQDIISVSIRLNQNFDQDTRKQTLPKALWINCKD